MSINNELDNELLDKMRDTALNALEPITREFVEMADGIKLSSFMHHQNEIMRDILIENQQRFLAGIESLNNKIKETVADGNYQDFKEWASQYTMGATGGIQYESR